MITQKAFDNLEGMNEAEVRLYFIDPVLKRLGYLDRDDLYIKLEETLQYPFYHIGRQSKKDLPLGRVDYRAGLKGRRGSFVIEAKAPSAGIGSHAIEQAHSYAAHANVGANYYALCDGVKFMIFETLSGPSPKAITCVETKRLEEDFYKIEAILGPENLERRCHLSYDTGLPLLRGFGSSIDVRGGDYTLDEWRLRALLGDKDVTEQLSNSFPIIDQTNELMGNLRENFQMRISEGSVFRDSDGRVCCNVEFMGISKANEIGLDRMGLRSIILASRDEYISCNPELPTILESDTRLAMNRTKLPLPFDIKKEVEAYVDGNMYIICHAFVEERTMRGVYTALTKMKSPLPGFSFELYLAGSWSLRLL